MFDNFDLYESCEEYYEVSDEDFYYDDFINAVCDYFKSMNMRTSVTPTAWWYATDILACVKEFSEVIQLPFTYDVLKTAVEKIAI